VKQVEMLASTTFICLLAAVSHHNSYFVIFEP